MAGKKAPSDGRGSAKSTPVKQKQMKNKKARCVIGAVFARGTRNAAACDGEQGGGEDEKDAVKAEDMDEDDADGDEDYDTLDRAEATTEEVQSARRERLGSVDADE